MLIDYHLHLENGPLTRAWLEEFLAVGRERGVEEFGFSEHAYNYRQARNLLDQPWAQRHSVRNLEDYLFLIQEAKEAGWPVKLGLEVDYAPGKEEAICDFLNRYPWDFVLGSVHWLGDWGFDNPEFAAEWERRNPEKVYREYFRLFRQAAESGLFDIMAHPDVIKVFGHRPAMDLTPFWEEAASVLASTGLCAEVSTAGWRKPVGELYPAPGFLSICRRFGVPVTLASDAHRPEDVGRDFLRAVEILRSCGYRELTRFAQRRRTFVPL